MNPLLTTGQTTSRGKCIAFVVMCLNGLAILGTPAAARSECYLPTSELLLHFSAEETSRSFSIAPEGDSVCIRVEAVQTFGIACEEQTFDWAFAGSSGKGGSAQLDVEWHAPSNNAEEEACVRVVPSGQATTCSIYLQSSRDPSEIKVTALHDYCYDSQVTADSDAPHITAL